MKKILVPTDFSKYSEYALEVAASLAKKFNAEIIVVHMMGLSHSSMNKTDARTATEALYYLKLSEKKFKEFLDKPYLKGIRVNETVQNYTIFSELNNVAKEHNANLIVMGSHGTQGLVQEVFVGSNTEKVVRTSEIPVLVIKERMEDFKLEKVVFACDFKDENAKVYKSAMELFEGFDAEVHLLYVNLPHKFRNSEYLETRVKDFLFKADSGDLSNLDKVVYYNDYTVEDGVHAYSSKINADVVAIPTHGRRGLAHFFSGSISEDIANHISLPVMTFKM